MCIRDRISRPKITLAEERTHPEEVEDQPGEQHINCLLYTSSRGENPIEFRIKCEKEMDSIGSSLSDK